MNRLRIVMRGGGISHTYPAPAAFRNYDHAGRCMASKERSFTVSGDTISYGTILSSYSYRYDECNNLTKLTCSVAGSTWSTVYTYDSDNRPKTTTLANNTVITNTYDTLGRLANRKIGLNSDYVTTLTYILGDGTNTTTALVATYQNGSDSAYSYEYDAVGNITSITQGTTSISYEYDVANRLTRENNSILNQTIVYDYTNELWGNLQSKKIYAYTTIDTDLLPTLTPIDTIGYTYNSTGWTDQLTEYNGQTINYDSMGNPTTYRGYTMTWRGKQLTSASNGTNTLTFEYNEDGLRQKKTVNGVDTNYFYNGSVLIGMQRGTSKFLFSYDASGNVVSVNYNGTEYYYLRNAQGDIVKIIDASGNPVVEYTYDTWGKKVSTTGDLAGTLGLIQPFRYRGYVYDWETGFYYLQSRYYDPTTGRFISADVLLSTGQGVLGHNCYMYCLGNPVGMVDDEGTAARGTITVNMADDGTPLFERDSLKEALVCAAIILRSKTRRNNVEYACVIYNVNGKYQFSTVTKGDHLSVKPEGADLENAVAVIHSHPFCVGHAKYSNYLSEEDKEYSHKHNIPTYLAAPNGNIIGYYAPHLIKERKEYAGDIFDAYAAESVLGYCDAFFQVIMSKTKPVVMVY